MADARTATPADFDRAAQQHANTFWFWAVVTGIVFYYFGLWAVPPAAISGWCIIKSVACTRYGQSLRNGTFPIPNPHNGCGEA